VRERKTFLLLFSWLWNASYQVFSSHFPFSSLDICGIVKKRGGQGSVDSLGLQRNLDVWKNLSLVGFGVCSDQLSVYSWARTCKLLAGVSRGDTFYDPLV
jgi:hypothetical protein